MASDVLMGNDQDASRWIRAFRVSPPEGEAGGRRVNRRRGAPVAAGAGAAAGDGQSLSADVPGVDVPGLDVPAGS
jgi:hypothetical protein